MTIVAPGGDPRQAVAMPMTWSDQNETPSQSEDENVITYGDVRATLNENSVTIEIGGVTLKISAAGLAIQGGDIGHNGLNIGATHIHGGVIPGPATTTGPQGNGPTP